MPDPKNIDDALFALMADPPVLTKDQAGQVGSQKTKYADLIQAQAVIFPKLVELGLLWITSPTIRMLPETGEKDGPRFVLDWELKHIASDTKREGAFPLPPNANPMQNGSAITYARRYALLAITNTVAEDEDDDGRGYAGRGGMAQRANVRQERSQPAAQSTAQRAAAPAARAERAAPAQRPEVPAPTSPAPAGRDTMKMLTRMAIVFGEMEVTDRDERLALLKDMVQRDLKSGRDLTWDECRGVLDAMDKASKTDNPLVSLIEIYHRTSGTGATAAEKPPARKQAARKATPPARSTRESVTGTPAEPGDDAPPWETEPPAEPSWPETATPGGGS